jgi:hypothetical protein
MMRLFLRLGSLFLLSAFFAVAGFVLPASIAYDGHCTVAAEDARAIASWEGEGGNLGSQVTWNNGWRTPNGKFASPLGGGQAGAAAEM